MIDLRWLVSKRNDFERVLQYRVLMPSVDASGALCPGSGWSEWMDVPEILEALDQPKEAGWR